MFNAVYIVFVVLLISFRFAALLCVWYELYNNGSIFWLKT